MEFAPLLLDNGDQIFEAVLPRDHWLFADHVVRGHRVLPGVAYFDLAITAIMRRYPHLQVRAFEDCLWIRPAVSTVDGLRLHIRLTRESDVRCRYEISDEGGILSSGWATSAPMIAEPWPAAKTIWRHVTEESVLRFNRRTVYEAFAGMGIDYGPRFRRIHFADIHDNLAVALLSDNDAVPFSLCNLLDCSFQSGMAISIGTETASLMPFSLGMMVFHAPIDFQASHAFHVVTEKTTPYRTSIGIHDENGAPLVSVLDLGVKPSRL
jgi:Polyketide synthase dehydratase